MSRGDIVDLALVVWFALTAVSVAFVAWDAFRRTPEMTVMKWGWVAITLYTGPIGGALYVLSCMEPAPGAHEEFVRPLWKQALGSSIHCLAGDATGIIAAATVTIALGAPMWIDIAAEYVFGFAFGLLFFQAVFMREMLGSSYAAAVKRSFMPEWLSMNCVMAGMVPVMVVLMSTDMSAMEPASIRYWGTMSLATITGLALAYPVNVWLVATGMKHGMGTVRVLGASGHSMAAESARIQSVAGETPAVGPGAMQHPGPGNAAAPPVSHTPESPQKPVHGQPATHQQATPPSVTLPQLVAVTSLTLIALGGGVLLAALSGDLTMSSCGLFDSACDVSAAAHSM